jgi:V8-like Glu-specific endopeptidase
MGVLAKTVIGLIATFSIKSAAIVSSLNTNALRQTVKNCNLNKNVNFFSAKEDLERISIPFQISSAVIKIESYLANSCTAQFISDQGHLLTADHCLEDCRLKNDGKLDNNSTCEFKINGIKQKFKVNLHSKDCRTKYDFPEITNGLSGEEELRKLTEKCTNSFDVAILEPLDKSDLKDFSCLKMSDQNISESNQEDFFTLGFPNKTFRNEPKSADLISNSNGVDLQYSIGNIVNQDHCVTKGKRIEFPTRTAEFRSHYIQTNIDTTTGSSGGALFNSKGEILGVVSFSLDQLSLQRHCEGSSFFTPLAKSLDKMKSANNFDWRSLKCETRKVPKN